MGRQQYVIKMYYYVFNTSKGVTIASNKLLMDILKDKAASTYQSVQKEMLKFNVSTCHKKHQNLRSTLKLYFNSAICHQYVHIKWHIKFTLHVSKLNTYK